MPGTTFVEVTNELLEQAGDGWSPPIRFRFDRVSDDRVELIFENNDLLRAAQEVVDLRPEMSAKTPAARDALNRLQHVAAVLSDQEEEWP